MFVVMVVGAGVVGGGAGASGGLVDEQRGFTCGVFDADGILRSTTNSYFALYSSGKSYLRCVAEGSNSSGVIHTTNFAETGQTCNIPVTGTTTQWSTRHSRDGTAQLTCHGRVEN